jgi:hypothetical protein
MFFGMSNLPRTIMSITLSLARITVRNSSIEERHDAALLGMSWEWPSSSDTSTCVLEALAIEALGAAKDRAIAAATEHCLDFFFAG